MGAEDPPTAYQTDDIECEEGNGDKTAKRNACKFQQFEDHTIQLLFMKWLASANLFIDIIVSIS